MMSSNVKNNQESSSISSSSVYTSFRRLPDTDTTVTQVSEKVFRNFVNFKEEGNQVKIELGSKIKVYEKVRNFAGFLAVVGVIAGICGVVVASFPVLFIGGLVLFIAFGVVLALAERKLSSLDSAVKEVDFCNEDIKVKIGMAIDKKSNISPQDKSSFSDRLDRIRRNHL